jgi:hypothetical protein
MANAVAWMSMSLSSCYLSSFVLHMPTEKRSVSGILALGVRRGIAPDALMMDPSADPALTSINVARIAKAG